MKPTPKLRYREEKPCLLSMCSVVNGGEIVEEVKGYRDVGLVSRLRDVRTRPGIHLPIALNLKNQNEHQ